MGKGLKTSRSRKGAEVGIKNIRFNDNKNLKGYMIRG